VVAAAVFAFFRPGDDSDQVDMDTVHLCRVQRGDFVVSILQSGELRAKNSRQIINEAYRDAEITEIVEDGTMVTNGQLLFELESSQLSERYLDQQGDVAAAEAALKLEQETLEIARLKNATDLESAKLGVELARMDLQKYLEVESEQMVEKAKSDIMLAEEELKRARSEMEGTQELYDKGYANKNDLDSDRLSVQRKEVEVRNKTTDLHILEQYTLVKKQKELENALTNAVSALERLKKSITSEIQSKEAAIKSRETRLEIERNQLVTREEQFANTKVYADFEGQVFYPKTGQYSIKKIEKGATVQYRQPILSYPDLTDWELRVGIPEAMIDKVSIGQEAVATLEALPDVVLRGRVTKISAVPDSKSWYSTGVKTYTIEIDTETEAVSQLKPGMSATVEIVTDQLHDVLYVPIQAVVSSGGKHYVYEVKRGRKNLREVEIGKYNTKFIEIVSGLKENEQLMLYAEVEMEADVKLRKSPLSEEPREEE
jgi:multidrug efflux pump subunit AcrA (membrane-fusion protein)